MAVGKLSVSVIPLRIRQIREQRDLSQIAFGERLGVSRTTIQGWERGDKSPALERLDDIAAALSCEVDDLLRMEDPPQPPFITNILPDVLAGAGLAPEPPPPDVQQPAPQAHAPPGAVDMHDLLAQLVQSQAHLSQAMARMAEGQAELQQGQAEIRKVQAEISRAVADLAAQEQGATRVDARRGRKRAG